MSPRAVIKVGDTLVDVEDPRKIEPDYVDVVTEARNFNGTIYASLGSIVVDGEGEQRRVVAQIVSRLRINVGAATVLRDFLNSVLPPPDPKAKKGPMN